MKKILSPEELAEEIREAQKDPNFFKDMKRFAKAATGIYRSK